MALSPKQVKVLEDAIKAYRFPPIIFDFAKKHPKCLRDMKAVETQIREDLVSGNSRRVKDGLSNIIFWGYGQMGVREHRFEKFRKSLRPASRSRRLRRCAQLFKTNPAPELKEIKRLNLPGFSGMSFISKIRMFLDPERSATLDLQLAKLRCHDPKTVLSDLKMSPKATQIRITTHNQEIYETWCETLLRISKKCFRGRYSAAEIERGFFQLIQCGGLEDAATILRNTDCWTPQGKLRKAKGKDGVTRHLKLAKG